MGESVDMETYDCRLECIQVHARCDDEMTYAHLGLKDTSQSPGKSGLALCVFSFSPKRGPTTPKRSCVIVSRCVGKEQ